MNEKAVDGWDWAFVEIMGHRSHAGRVREEERFGIKMIRIDVPIKGDPVQFGWETHCYNGPAIFSYTPSTEEAVMRENLPFDPVYRLSPPSKDLFEAAADMRAEDDDHSEFSGSDDVDYQRG